MLVLPREFRGLDPLVHSLRWLRAERRAVERMRQERPAGSFYAVDISSMLHAYLRRHAGC